MKKLSLVFMGVTLFILIGMSGIFISRHFGFSEEEKEALVFIVVPPMIVVLFGPIIKTIEDWREE